MKFTLYSENIRATLDMFMYVIFSLSRNIVVIMDYADASLPWKFEKFIPVPLLSFNLKNNIRIFKPG